MRLGRFFVIVMLAAICASALFAQPVRVLTTGDMHGYLTSQKNADELVGGTAEMLAYWRNVEAYRPNRYLVISCGDNFTGQAISTVFKGDSALSVMNLMGYDVSALGNHEFDFRVDQIPLWKASANFPFVCANLFDKNGIAPNFVVPFIINDEQGVKVAVIGLMTVELQQNTNNAKDFIVKPYKEVLPDVVKEARNRGAHIVVIAAHVPQAELVKLAEDVKSLNITLMLGGHSHEFTQRKVNDTWVVNSGSWWQSYTRIDMDYNPKTSNTTVLTSKQVWLKQGKPKTDDRVKREIESWQKMMNSEFGKEIAYTSSGLFRVPDLYTLIPQTWLELDSSSDFAIINIGALRQDFKSGSITKGDIYSLMPFLNTLLRIKLNGTQLSEFLKKNTNIATSGVMKSADLFIDSRTNQPLDESKTYYVLMPNFIYDTTAELMKADSNPEVVNKDWKERTIDWFIKHPTNKEKPIEGLIKSN